MYYIFYYNGEILWIFKQDLDKSRITHRDISFVFFYQKFRVFLFVFISLSVFYDYITMWPMCKTFFICLMLHLNFEKNKCYFLKIKYLILWNSFIKLIIMNIKCFTVYICSINCNCLFWNEFNLKWKIYTLK